MAVKAIFGTIVCGLCPTILMTASALAVDPVQDRVSGTEKGSLLIFSDVEIKWSAAGAVTQDTFIQLTNDNSLAVDVQMYFINGDAPLAAFPAAIPPAPPPPITERAHPGWNNVDNSIHLTANQPTYWSALTGQPAQGGLSSFTVLDPAGLGGPGRPDLDPGAPAGSRYLRGFILAWAVDSNNAPICWNHLAGNATIVGYGLGTAFEYNAWAFQCVRTGLNTGDPIPGAVTTVGGVLQGKLNLDGVDYAKSFDQLLMNFQAVGATAFSGPKLVTSNTDLTLHLVTTDLRENNTGPRTTKAKFDVWNQNEVKFSNAERCITCWFQGLLGTWAPFANHFTRANLQTDVGKARIDGLQSDVVCNDPLFHSTAESLLGVIDTILVFDGGLAYAEAGTNLFGLGFQSAYITYDVLGGSPPPGNSGKTDAPADVIENTIRAINTTLGARGK